MKLTILSLTSFARPYAERDRDRLRRAHPGQLVRLTKRKLSTIERDRHEYLWGHRPRFSFTVRVYAEVSTAAPKRE